MYFTSYIAIFVYILSIMANYKYQIIYKNYNKDKKRTNRNKTRLLNFAHKIPLAVLFNNYWQSNLPLELWNPIHLMGIILSVIGLLLIAYFSDKLLYFAYDMGVKYKPYNKS